MWQLYGNNPYKIKIECAYTGRVQSEINIICGYCKEKKVVNGQNFDGRD